MANVRKWQGSIRIGFQVFDKDGGAEFGAVRDVCPAGKLELLVNVENAASTASRSRRSSTSTPRR